MVEGTRFRLVGLIEWVIAAGFVVGLLAVGAAVLGDFRAVRPVVPVIAGASVAPVVPASVRSGSVSVPLLVLPDGKTLTTGAPTASLDALGHGETAFERTTAGQRETRAYRYAGMEFVVVIADDKIVAIFR
jgi:hypothetical protein